MSDFFTVFQSAHQVLEDLLHETSHLLARVSTHTAVVVGPHIEADTVRSVQLVTLQPSLVLALAILSNGRIEKCVLHVTADTDDATIATAGALLDTQLAGSRWDALPEVRPVAGPAADTLAREARDALAAPRGAGDHRTALRGRRQPARGRAGGVPHHRQRGAAARAARTPGRGGVVGARPARPGPTVRIGSENPIDELRDCSIVVAPYRVDGEVAGTVGVLGPTRMDYRQALAAVEAISQQLGDVLS